MRYPCCESAKRVENRYGRLLYGRCPIHGISVHDALIEAVEILLSAGANVVGPLPDAATLYMHDGMPVVVCHTTTGVDSQEFNSVGDAVAYIFENHGT